jgi:recombination protein RecA
MANDKNRERAVDQAISQIERQFGRGSIMKMGEEKVLDIPAISTGSIALNLALGIGGVPRGRVVEIYGPESSGKTTLADTGEQALDIAEILVRSGAIDTLIVDSVAALVPRAEIEGDMGDSHMGLQARLMSQALRKLTGTISKSMTCVIFINQIRMKIGVMFGSPETTTGGNALKFYASQRLDIRRIGAIKEGDQVIGNRTRVKVVKNKIAPPFKEAEFDIIYGKGISKEGDILDLGVALGVIEKSGSWYSSDGERMGQGRENVKGFLMENQDIKAQITDLIMEKTGLKKVTEKPKEEAEESPEK